MPATKSDKEVLGTLEPWQDGSGKTLARRKKDAKDIIVDDLSATLEAHRASNRAAVIRKVKLDSDGSIWRPLLGKYSDGRSEAKKTHERKEIEPPRMWPADSVQAKERYGSADSRGFVKSADPLEYTGVAQWPKKPWKINHSSEDMLMQRPWLVYMESTSEDYLERFVLESREGCVVS